MVRTARVRIRALGGGGRQHRDIGVQQGGAPKEVVVFVTRLPTGGGVLRKASGPAV